MYRFADNEGEDLNEKIHKGLIPILEELSKLHFEESWVIAVNDGELMIVGSSPERLFDAFDAAIKSLGG